MIAIFTSSGTQLHSQGLMHAFFQPLLDPRGHEQLTTPPGLCVIQHHLGICTLCLIQHHQGTGTLCVIQPHFGNMISRLTILPSLQELHPDMKLLLFQIITQSNPDPFSRSQINRTRRSEFKRKNIKTDYKVRTPTSYIKLKTKALGRLRLFL